MAPEQNGGETKVYTLQRIAPILNVGCYLEAFYPTSGTLVTLDWRCVTFCNILTNSPRKMLVLWSRTGKLITTKLFCVYICVPVPVCACMCVVCVRHCVRGAPFDHISAYSHHCIVSYPDRFRRLHFIYGEKGSGIFPMREFFHPRNHKYAND